MKQKLKSADIPRVRNKILKEQGNRCAICKGDFTEGTYHRTKKKVVPKYISCLDHDHKTGQVRGVLCSFCNSLEGKFINAVNRYHREIKSNPYAIRDFLEGLSAYYEYHSIDRHNNIHPSFKTEEEKKLLKNKRARLKRKRESS